MKSFIIAVASLLFSAIAASTHAQVVPAATKNTISLSAGGLGSMFQPDYAGEGIAQTSPNRLYGPGAYVDFRVNRWVQVEAEARWLNFNQYIGIDEHTYLVGPRIPIMTWHHLTPYGKVLVGPGGGSFLNGDSFVVAYGGGVDYRLSRRFTLRCFDFEYQQWMLTPALHPYGGSVGLSYKIF